LHYEQKKFYFLAAGILSAKHIMVNKITEPEVLYFKDDGKIPTANTRFYCIAMLLKNGDIRVPNGWNNLSWRNGIFDFHHYHIIDQWPIQEQDPVLGKQDGLFTLWK
jgi:uncharacterized protein YjlB